MVSVNLCIQCLAKKISLIHGGRRGTPGGGELESNAVKIPYLRGGAKVCHGMLHLREGKFSQFHLREQIAPFLPEVDAKLLPGLMDDSGKVLLVVKIQRLIPCFLEKLLITHKREHIEGLTPFS